LNSLFLSPHLDDAVLSCALRLINECDEGEVTVATLFSKGWPLSFGPDLYGGRRREDERALADLDKRIKIMHLGYKDAIFRHLYYTSFSRIVIGDHQFDKDLALKLAANLKKLIDSRKAQNIFLPLAVGRHVDHRLTHQLWCSLSQRSDCKIIFYEDRPYSFLPGNLNIRLKEIGARAELPEAGLQALIDGMEQVNFYKSIAKNKKDRDNYIEYARAEIAGESNNNLSLQGEIVETDDMGKLIKIRAAVGDYRSQMAMLFGDMQTFDNESATYAQSLGSAKLYAERYWHLQSSTV